MAVALSPIGNDAPFVDASGNPLNAGELYIFLAGSSTPATTYQDDGGVTQNANPVVLNANGYPASGGSVVSIWLTTGASYLFTLKTSAGVTVWSRDDIEPINDTSSAIDQWIAGPTPTFVNTTSFTLVGDQTSTFHAGRRLKTTNTGGTIYSTITNSVFGASTTVTVENDSGTLDSGLTAVSYGILSQTNPSIPSPIELVAGTVSAPSLARQTDENTGIYFPASDQVGVVVGGVEVARAKATGSSYYRKNALINGAFPVPQRGTIFTSTSTPANNDDTYLLDRWTLLSDGNDTVDVSQNTSVIPTGGLFSCALDVETANRKFGIIQFIEQRNCHRLIGGTVSLSFKARKGDSNATVGTMRAAILAWDGTADTLTSDVVSAWGASGTNPTLVANWTYENTPADLTLTTSFQTFKIEGIAADTANAKNLAVFLYYNNADGTVADFIYITDVQLELGSIATEFDQRSFQEEEDDCLRYLWVWNYNADADAYTGFVGSAIDTTNGITARGYPKRMRAVPALTVSDVAHFSVTMGSAGDATNAITLANAGFESARLGITVASAVLTADSAILLLAVSANARLTFLAEL